MFEGLPKSKFEIISPEGEVRATTNAIHTGGEVVIVPDPSVVIQPGDEMRRTLPNGTDDTFEVVDPQFHDRTFGIPAHFQVKVRRKGMFPHHTGGHLNITVSGPNARVNVNSTDRSTNIVGDSAVFGDIRAAIIKGVPDEAARGGLIEAVDEMEATREGGGFVAAYQKFIGLAADHIGVIGPFLPALSGLLG